MKNYKLTVQDSLPLFSSMGLDSKIISMVEVLTGLAEDMRKTGVADPIFYYHLMDKVGYEPAKVIEDDIMGYKPFFRRVDKDEFFSLLACIQDYAIRWNVPDITSMTGNRSKALGIAPSEFWVQKYEEDTGVEINNVALHLHNTREACKENPTGLIDHLLADTQLDELA